MSRAIDLLSILSPETRELLAGYLPESEQARCLQSAFESQGKLDPAASHRLLYEFRSDLVRQQIDKPCEKAFDLDPK